MIPELFYETTYTHNSGVTCTDVLHNLPASVVSGDYMRPYYMGFINYDDMPTNMLYTRVHVNDGDMIAEIPEKRNHGWGFVLDSDTSYTPHSFLGYPNVNDVIQRVGGSGSRTARFINSAIMSRYATANKITLTLRYIFIPESDLDANDSAYDIPDTTNNVYVSMTKSISVPFISTTALGNGFDKFYTNETALDFGTQTVYGSDVPLTFIASDFGTDENPTCRRVVEISGTNYVLFAQLALFDYPCYGRYRRPSDETPTKLMIAPFLEMDAFESNHSIAPDNRKWINVNTNPQATLLEIEIENQFGEIIETAKYISGALTSNSIGFGNFYIKNGTMNHGTTDAYWYAANSAYNYPGYGRDGIMMGRHINHATNTMDNIFVIYPFLRPKDIWFSVAPFHKIDTVHDGQTNVNPQNAYTVNYSTQIFDSNAPTEIRKQDTTTNLTPDLMTWQIPSADITIDEFNIDDMPAYEPTDNVIDKFTGDSITNTVSPIAAPNNYVTYWVMDKNQVDEFGSYIWKNLLDFDSGGNPLPGVWENIKIAATNYWGTGTLDPAGVMSFVVSLRYYPMELHNQSYATTHKNIYFGTGRLGIPVITSENTRKLNDIALARSGGNITITGDDAKFLYRDFRDYVGASATMYIPFCGTYQIPISEIEEGASFHIMYQIDITTGALTAYVDAHHGDHEYPLIIANGMCGFEIPLSATNANRLNAAILGDAQNAIGAILQPIEHAGGKIKTAIMGGMSAGAGEINPSQISGDTMSVPEALASVSIGPIAAIGGAAGIETGANMLNLASDMLTRPAVGMPLLQGGRGWAALGAPLTAYIQIRRGRYMYPANYTHTQGKPENRERQINQIRGYAEAVNVDTTGLSCTETERQMIKRILETGFYRK